MLCLTHLTPLMALQEQELGSENDGLFDSLDDEDDLAGCQYLSITLPDPQPPLKAQTWATLTGFQVGIPAAAQHSTCRACYVWRRLHNSRQLQLFGLCAPSRASRARVGADGLLRLALHGPFAEIATRSPPLEPIAGTMQAVDGNAGLEKAAKRGSTDPADVGPALAAGTHTLRTCALLIAAKGGAGSGGSCRAGRASAEAQQDRPG